MGALSSYNCSGVISDRLGICGAVGASLHRSSKEICESVSSSRLAFNSSAALIAALAASIFSGNRISIACWRICSCWFMTGVLSVVGGLATSRFRLSVNCEFVAVGFALTRSTLGPGCNRLCLGNHQAVALVEAWAAIVVVAVNSDAMVAVETLLGSLARAFCAVQVLVDEYDMHCRLARRRNGEVD